jgi:cobaltochelatase CobN
MGVAYGKPHVTAQEKPQVLLFMSSHTSKAKSELLLELAQDQPFILTKYSSSGKSEPEVADAWQHADLVLLDGINPSLSNYMFASLEPFLKQFPDVPVIALGDPNNTKLNQGLNEKIRQDIVQYFNHAGRYNYRQLMLYLSNKVFRLSNDVALPPRSVPTVGLYHPKWQSQVSDQESVFFNWLNPNPKQPLIAVAIHRSVIDYEQQQVVDALITGLEQKGAKAFAFFFEGEDEALSYLELLMDEQLRTRVHLIINYRSLHYAEKRRQEFEQLGVPVLHALNYSEGDAKAFATDVAGVSATLTPFFLVMPEDAGSVDPTIIAASENGIKQAIPEQLDALVERAYNHAQLAILPNQDKKIAAFIWNYPPGEKNIGAAFLDVPSSLATIVKALKAEGYRVTEKDMAFFIDSAGQLLRPYYRNEDATGLIEKNLADFLPLSRYLKWFNELPESVRKPIVERWGKPNESRLLTQHQGNPAFLIPRMALGNLIVLPQGVRGDSPKAHNQAYHSTQTPVSHSYLAMYLYAREVFQADALIHLGTHGSQEWLNGKERGLSVWDAPNLAVGNLPVFYPYIIDNVGEAMQAKRRGRATLISHLTPGFAKAGLYAEVAQLNELIDNYLLLDDGQTKQNTRDRIIELAARQHIFNDLGLLQTGETEIIPARNGTNLAGVELPKLAPRELAQLQAKFEDYLPKIQDYLEQLAQQSQPLGMHVFGELPPESHLYSTILQMLGDEFMQVARLYEDKHQLTLADEHHSDQLDVTQLEALPGFQLLKHYLSGGRDELGELPEFLRKQLTVAEGYWNNFQQIAETQNLIKALSAQYIPVGHGGDPIRNPQAVPTGRNLVGFNPAKVPSKEAYQAGVQLMEQTLRDYHAKHGRYPEKLAFSLWSLETMRHQGVLEAQILHAIGVRPKWNQQGNVSGIEVIPFSELGRPRIDVVISATGLYRDAFPNVMIYLAKAIDQVAKMKEDYNHLYHHTLELKSSLLAAGKSEDDANYLSSIRIFSNESGTYGTGLVAQTLDSGRWDNDAEMAKLYLRRMGFAYGKDETRWSEDTGASELYSKVLSGTQAVIFSRSTNLYALLTNDDPFQYFGGAGLAVRHLDGKTPEMYVSNLRRKDQIKVQEMKDFLNQELRSRYFHPRWIKAMQDSGYAGATAILDRVNNLWGWEVMTPEAVRDDHWQEFFNVYVDDKYQLDMREFFEQHNPDSLAQMIERMLEAARKGYWQPDEQTIKKLVKTYIELASQYDIVSDNARFNHYINQQAAGFGFAPRPKPEALSSNPMLSATQPVQGQKLEQVQTQPSDRSNWLLWMFILMTSGLGVIHSMLERQPKP